MNHTINICLIPDTEVYDTCARLNNFDTTSYNTNSRDFIPHATLSMKTLSDEQIEKLYQDILALGLKKQRTKLEGYYAKEVSPGDIWTGLGVEKTPSLHKLQKAVGELSKKYEAQKRTPDTYAIDDFYEEKEIQFYKEDEYLARESFHITLGKQDIENPYNKMDIPTEVEFTKLVIGKIGNYGSVREILFEVDLK